MCIRESSDNQQKLPSTDGGSITKRKLGCNQSHSHSGDGKENAKAVLTNACDPIVGATTQIEHTLAGGFSNASQRLNRRGNGQRTCGNYQGKDMVINRDDKRLAGEERWKHDGVRVIPGNQLDPNVPATAGMNRKAAINFARTGAKKLWAGTVTIDPDAKTGAHHHGHLESVIYRQGSGPDALGRGAAIRCGSRAGGFYFCAAICATSRD
jgi:hypothetical protein